MKVKDLSVEELIKLAEEGSVPNYELTDELDKFIYDLGIYPKTGERVAANIIYHNYIMWKEQLGETDIMSRQGFFRKFKKVFKRQIGSGERYYNVNKDAFSSDLYTRIEMRKLMREEREWYQGKRKRRKKGTTKSSQD